MAPENQTFTQSQPATGSPLNQSHVKDLTWLTNNQSPTQYSADGYLAITLERKFHNPLEDASFLRQKYATEGLSTNFIAGLVGCSHQAVASALIRHKIPRRSDTNLGRCQRDKSHSDLKSWRAAWCLIRASNGSLNGLRKEERADYLCARLQPNFPNEG